MERPRSYRLVGIDFGTTYSGVSWAWSERFAESHRTVLKWNGDQGVKQSAKVPTQILYQDGRIKWGFDIKPEEKPLKWFKLLLLTDEDMKPELRNASFIKEAREMLDKLNKKAETVVSDYLKCIWEHAKQDIIRESGQTNFDGLPLIVVITFPAIWPQYAQSRLREAAVAAGIADARPGGETRLELCAEPEAGALAVMEDNEGHVVDSGESFVVADAGGGTVDLITYTLHDTQSWEMSECVKGDGDLCGGVFLDESFTNKIAEWIPEKKRKRLSDVLYRQWVEREWEFGLKRRFDGSPERDWRLQLPLEWVLKPHLKLNPFSKLGAGKKGPQIQDQALKLQRGDVETIFNPIIENILSLVEKQLVETKKKTGNWPKAVLLVGGLGQNAYLYDRLQGYVRNRRIHVRVPSEEHAWSAICRGALIRATVLDTYDGGGGLIRPIILSRKSRMSYGIVVTEEYEEGRHSAEDKKFVQSHQRHMAVGQMHWYLRKDHDMTAQEVHRMHWIKPIRGPQARNQISVQIMKCAEDQPPTRRDSTVKPECNVVCTISTPFEHLPGIPEADNAMWRSVDFELEMRCVGTSLQFVAYYNNVRQRPVHVAPPLAEARRSGDGQPQERQLVVRR